MRGLTPADVRDVLVEAFHSDLEGATREQRSLADRVLDEIIEVLQSDLSMGGIWRAVRAVTGQDPAPASAAAELTLDEWDRLSQMFSEDFRVRIGERLMTVETQLYALRHVGSEASADTGPPVDLSCTVVGGDGTSVTSEMLCDLLVQSCVRQLRHRPDGAPRVTVVIAGADALNERMRARLDVAAESPGVRVILLFRDLKEGQLEVMGSGGAVGFFRLVNEQQARRAADSMGRDHSFNVSQLTSSRGTNTSWSQSSSQNSSASVSWSNMNGDAYLGMQPLDGGDALNLSSGTATGSTTGGGTSDQYSQTEQRVEEHAVEPTVLRQLADGCLLLVEFGHRVNGRRVVAVDCGPWIAWRPRASAERLPYQLAQTIESSH